MTEERRLSTSDIAHAVERERADAARQTDGLPRAVEEGPSPLFADEELTGYRTR